MLISGEKQEKCVHVKKKNRNKVVILLKRRKLLNFSQNSPFLTLILTSLLGPKYTGHWIVRNRV